MTVGIKYRDKKLGRYRKGVGPMIGSKRSRPKVSKGKHRMIAKFDGTCALCTKSYKAGSRIVYDPNKEPGRKCVHETCYKDYLSAKQG